MSGTLTASASSVEAGEQITLTYSTTSANPKNRVGLYPDPVDRNHLGSAALWAYTPAASGTAVFATEGLGAGNFVAFFLADDGCAWLADPVRFTVRRTSLPEYRSAFGRGGSGPGQFAGPAGITVDQRGQLWVADTGNDRVQAFTRDGKLVRVLAGRLKAPEAVAVDAAGNVYVADTGNHRVAQYSWWGGFVREFGAGKLDNPRGIALDSAGRLLVADTGHQRVARFDTRTGAALTDITEKVSSPQGITGDGAGGAWIVQNGRDVAVVRYNADGRAIGSLEFGPSSPADVAVTASGDAYVTMPDHGRVTQFGVTGSCRVEFGSDALGAPLGVAVDTAGGIWVADAGHHRVVGFGVAA
ncbi:NHL repeat-containing protein [Amycolatopsis sp., V23-08]|uniref:NHL repeat-containing protein n=1 Tax=Amycolatopsis heterodermiae TaxID=3110235 RepID=A0ABU5QYX6_9PSEU|nr:NHL repeat-containing protein [Amycolatopsis sp., V23-08]MEA5359128.1 NHL repeat-containing protein [Amycolatopsis sp., V23-08]